MQRPAFHRTYKCLPSATILYHGIVFQPACTWQRRKLCASLNCSFARDYEKDIGVEYPATRGLLHCSLSIARPLANPFIDVNVGHSRGQRGASQSTEMHQSGRPKPYREDDVQPVIANGKRKSQVAPAADIYTWILRRSSICRHTLYEEQHLPMT